MTRVKLVYNPYSLKIRLLIQTAAGESAVTSNSPLAFIFGKPMNKWLEPADGWKGFFAELCQTVGDNKLQISFVGTAEDFEDLTAAKARAEKNSALAINLTFLPKDDEKIRAEAPQKLRDLIQFLTAPPATTGGDFLASICPALKETLRDDIRVNVISTVKNFFARNIFPDASAKLKFVVNEPNQDIATALLRTFADVNKSLILFVFDSETISSERVTVALRNITQTIGQDEYAQTLYETFFFVCTDCEDPDAPSAERIKNRLYACGFNDPKLFMVSSKFAEMVLAKNFEEENFVACRKILSAPDCKNFQDAPIPLTLKNHYAEKIARCREILNECNSRLKFSGSHAPAEIKSTERRRDDALNEIALINSNLPALEQTILTCAERYVLPCTVRKIYLGVKKKFAVAERDINQKISDEDQSLQRLRQKIFASDNQPAPRPSDTTSDLHFDDSAFRQLSRDLLERLASVNAPAAEDAVDKNIGGRADIYLKLADAQNYSQIVIGLWKKTLTQFAAEAVAYLNEHLLTPARNADKQKLSKNSATDFEKILSDKNFDIPPVEFHCLLSYEQSSKKYVHVEYVPVDEILSEYRRQAERLLNDRLNQLRNAAAKFVSNFQAQAENPKYSTPTKEAPDHELQRLKSAVRSKENRLNAYKRDLIALKKFDEQLDRLLEINS